MNKQIPCRTCGKLFKPCSYCQNNQNGFKWRNFACSLECANEYINRATQHRNNETNKTLMTNEDVSKKKKSFGNLSYEELLNL